ncbi:hypothetical protein ABW19_dt0209193 [Dactylella cylindrospora]|nr:hypothetical protein ABW19_dt0209193 [Dactylella cylindrospora]
MSETTKQRHEQRMAERRRGAGGRVVTQAFGFDLPLIAATPPAIRAQKAANKAEEPKPTVEPPAPVSVPPTILELVIEEGQRRRSGRLSRGASVVSTGSVQDAPPNSEGSARKRRRLDSNTPNGSVSSRRSSRRSISAAVELPQDTANGIQPTPEVVTTEVVTETIVFEAIRTPARTTPRVSPRRVSLAPEASLLLSSPSPLPPKKDQPAITSSVSPEPPPFRPDPVIPEETTIVEEEEEVEITPEPTIQPTPEPSPPPPAQTTGLRGQRKKRSKPAVAAVTPIPRGKRRRQPSPDKFLTPSKAAEPESEEEEGSATHKADLSVEQIVREEAAAMPSPEIESAQVEEQIVNEASAAAKTARGRRGRKPKSKKLSVEIPVEDLPIQEDTAVLSDVEQAEEEAGMELDESEIREEAENEGDFEDEEEVVEEEPVNESTRSRKRDSNVPRKPRQKGQSKRRDENGELKETFDITVHRIPKQGDYSFKFPKQPNNIQIVSEFILGIIDKQLESLSLKKGEEADREEKARLKLRENVVKTFSSALENRFIGMANKADNIKMKSTQLRRLQREKQQLRDQLMEIRESREEIARQMDGVRRKHEEASEKASKQQYINDTLKNLESILEQGRAKAATIPVEERESANLVGLDALITSVTEDMCGAEGEGKGILEQVKEMNRFLEASIAALQQ